MPGYATRLIDVRFGGHGYRILALQDNQQFDDPDGAAERAGVSSAQWPLFGQAWPAGHVLAQAMSAHDVAGLRILEVGCGLALSSLVLQQRGADITASDLHPLAETFLIGNALRNGLGAITYHDLPWAVPDAHLGCFDLIIGSDVLYERDHAVQLAALVQRHAPARSEVVLTDPGRGNAGAFGKAMRLLGYATSELRCCFRPGEAAPYRGRLLYYRRGGAGPIASGELIDHDRIAGQV